VPFREEGHLPLLHAPFALAAGRSRTVPVLVEPDGTVLPDSTDILVSLDLACPAAGLFSGDRARRESIHAWEERFDRSLGPATRRIAYFLLLADREAALAFVRPGAPKAEHAVMRATFPVARAAMSRAMRLDEGGYARSTDVLWGELGAVGEALADGRPYLAGEAFSAADLTWAALLYPLVLPAEFPLALPPLDALPPQLASVVTAVRATPGGQHALRMYAQHRYEIIEGTRP
jgi:glutathione S-transferase